VIRKYAILLVGAIVLSVLAAILGAIWTGISSGPGNAGASQDDVWLLPEVSRRTEADYQRAIERFKDRYSWLTGRDEIVEPPAEVVEEVVSAPEVQLPQWTFVGVSLEEGEANRYALVSEAGKVNKYKVGDVFADGTTLLAVGEQSLRVVQTGEEKDVFLYRRR
jgi:hypothetical protein